MDSHTALLVTAGCKLLYYSVEIHTPQLGNGVQHEVALYISGIRKCPNKRSSSLMKIFFKLVDFHVSIFIRIFKVEV